MGSTTRHLPIYVRDLLSQPPKRSELRLSELLSCPDLPRRARLALLPFSTRRLDALTKRQIRRWRERRNKRRCLKPQAEAEITHLIASARRRHDVLARRLAHEWALAAIAFCEMAKIERRRKREAAARAMESELSDGEETIEKTPLDLARMASGYTLLEQHIQDRRKQGVHRLRTKHPRIRRSTSAPT
jgi:hypothetical protein